MIGGVINLCKIEENWDETLRMTASMRAGTISPSALLRRLAAYPRQVSRHKDVEAKPMCFPKTLASVIAALGVFLRLTGPVFGEERGAGYYIPGLYASLINITPNKPGFAIGTGYLFYTGSAGGTATLPFGGILASNINANASLADLSLTYTFCPTILGAHYTVSLSVPYVWVASDRRLSKFSSNDQERTSNRTGRSHPDQKKPLEYSSSASTACQNRARQIRRSFKSKQPLRT
jgi:hypothetical protein